MASESRACVRLPTHPAIEHDVSTKIAFSGFSRSAAPAPWSRDPVNWYERQRATLHCVRFLFRFLARAIYWSRRGLANVIRRRAAPDRCAVHSSLVGQIGKSATSAQASPALGPRRVAAVIGAQFNREGFWCARSALKTQMSTIPRFSG